MKSNYILLNFLSILFLTSCLAEEETNSYRVETSTIKVNSSHEDLNISLFLDVSDRIDPVKHPNKTMQYYERDLGYIKSIAESFRLHILNKKLGQMNDQIQVFLDPNPEDEKINQIIDNLKITLNKNNVTRELIDSIDYQYAEMCENLYNAAIADSKYVGSDIWGFFKRKVNDYCIRDNKRNILVIITDGYAYHRDNKFKLGNKSSYLFTSLIEELELKNSEWEERYEKLDCGFIVENKDLKNLEVLVLGINAYKKTPFEEDIIRRYWTDWFNAMGITRFELKSADLPANIDHVIKRFILQPNAE
jgi:hypothetical protein